MDNVFDRRAGFLQLLREFPRIFSRKQAAQKKLVLWVIACNRAGKTTVLNILNKCPGSFIYNEGSAVAYHDYRIRSQAEISQLIAGTDKGLVIFELANDLQYADVFLNLYPGSKAFWVFRRYEDVVRDAVKKWGPAQKDMIIGIGQGVYRHPGQQAIAEKMAPETLSLIRAFSTREISPEDGAALLWYTRNQMYFQLGLDTDPRVLPVKYEDLVANPDEQGRRMFDFIACAFKTDYVAGIDPSHIGKTPLPGLDPEIGALCDQLMRRLDARCSMNPVVLPGIPA
jgi:hypothetical protein